MHINCNYLQTKVFSFKEIISSIPPQHKKILLIALLAFSSLAAIYLCWKYFFSVKPKPKETKVENDGDKKVENPPQLVLPADVNKVEDKQVDEKNKNDIYTNDDTNHQNDRVDNIAAPSEEVKTIAAKAIQEEENKEIAPIMTQDEQVDTTPPVNTQPIVETATGKNTQKEEEKEIAPTATQDEQVDITPPATTQSDVEKVAAKNAQEEEDPAVAAARKAQEAEAAKVAAEHARKKDAADRKAQKVVNVLMVGRSRSGKSTLMEMLQDPFYISPDMNLFYTTAQPKQTEIKLNDYTFRVLDTPGLFENVASNSLINKRSNEEIAQLIEAKISEVFGGEAYGNVDAVIFANSLRTGVNDQDIESIKFFVPKFGTHSKKLFVVTRSEDQTDDVIEKLRNQCAQHVQMGPLIQEEFGGKEQILFTGALSKDYLIFKSFAQARVLRVIALRERLIDALLPDTVTSAEKEEFHSQEIDKFNLPYSKFLENIPEKELKVVKK